MRRGIFNSSDRGKRGARVEVAPGPVRPLAFGAAHVARGVALEEIDRALSVPARSTFTAIMRPPRGSTECSTEAELRFPPRTRVIEPGKEPI